MEGHAHPHAHPSEVEVTPVSEHDYLDQDPVVRGQRYACISFLSPEDVLTDKDAFVIGRFLRSLGTDVAQMLDVIGSKFGADPDVQQTMRMLKERHAYLWSDGDMQTELKVFKGIHGQSLEDEFHAANGFKTSIRGIKVRGVYETVEDASSRAKAIKRFDDRFHVYVAEVGCWCPWSPNPDAIVSAEYSEAHLNTLMKKYHESLDAKDELYQSRKADAIKRMNEERDAWVQARREALAHRGPDATPQGSAGEPEQTSAAGEPEQTSAAGEPEQTSAAGEPDT
jgi:hypothetical protein